MPGPALVRPEVKLGARSETVPLKVVNPVLVTVTVIEPPKPIGERLVLPETNRSR